MTSLAHYKDADVTTVERNNPLASNIGQMIEPYRAQLAPFLRDGLTLERVAAELVLASRKLPKLAECAPMRCAARWAPAG